MLREKQQVTLAGIQNTVVTIDGDITMGLVTCVLKRIRYINAVIEVQTNVLQYIYIYV